MNNKPIRHGDLALIPVKELPEGLKKSNVKVLIKSSGGNPHSIDRGEVYFKNVNEYVFGYLIAKNTTLKHKEHGNQKLADGVYELRRQNEDTHEGMRVVED